MASLREELKHADSMYSNGDQKWVQYVRDHFWTIRSSASVIDLEAYQHNTMRYRLAEWLMDEFDMPYTSMWITLLINQLNSEEDFRNLQTILVPDMRVVDNLFSQFRNLNAQRNNM